MLPVSVLLITGILLGGGSSNFSWRPAIVSSVMAQAGDSVFANMPLIFAIGVALYFTHNDGVSAPAAVVAYGLMVKTIAAVAPLVLQLPPEVIIKEHLAGYRCARWDHRWCRLACTISGMCRSRCRSVNSPSGGPGVPR